MKRVLPGIVGIVVLFIIAGNVSAQEPASPNSAGPGVIQHREITMPQRPPGRMPGRQIDPNEMARREQMRRQVQEQVRQRAARRHQADPNLMPDANAPPASGIRRGPLTKEQHKQQLAEIEKLLQQEQDKYRLRLAKLTRIREIAAKQADTALVERTDKLIEQDRQHYEAKTRRFERRKNAIIRFLETAPADVNKSAAGG